MRVFIAIPLSEALKSELQCFVRRLKREWVAFKNIQWIEAKQYHLTLCFLGEIEEGLLPLLQARLQSAIVEISPFAMEFCSIDFFPTHQEPHAIVATIRLQSELVMLQQAIRQAVTSVLPGLDISRNFLPHVTLARMNRIKKNSIKENRLLSEPAYFEPQPVSLTCPVSSVQVFQSQLTAEGAHYIPLFQINLSSEK